MAYPKPVTEKPPVVPRGHDTNLAARITPPAVESGAYFPTFTIAAGNQLRVLNTDGFVWWASEPAP